MADARFSHRGFSGSAGGLSGYGRCDGATRDTDAIRANQLVVVVISRIVHETIAFPFFAGLFVEVRIWKKPEAEDPGWFAVNSFVDACRLCSTCSSSHKQIHPPWSAARNPGSFTKPKVLSAHRARTFGYPASLRDPLTHSCLGRTIPETLIARAPEFQVFGP